MYACLKQGHLCVCVKILLKFLYLIYHYLYLLLSTLFLIFFLFEITTQFYFDVFAVVFVYRILCCSTSFCSSSLHSMLKAFIILVIIPLVLLFLYITLSKCVFWYLWCYKNQIESSLYRRSRILYNLVQHFAYKV